MAMTAINRFENRKWWKESFNQFYQNRFLCSNLFGATEEEPINLNFKVWTKLNKPECGGLNSGVLCSNRRSIKRMLNNQIKWTLSISLSFALWYTFHIKYEVDVVSILYIFFFSFSIKLHSNQNQSNLRHIVQFIFSIPFANHNHNQHIPFQFYSF